MNCRIGLTTAAIVLCTISVTGAAITPAALPAHTDTDPPGAGPAATRSTAVIDEAALTVLKKVETAMFSLKSYSAECWTKIKYDPKSANRPGRVYYEMATLVAVKPNLMRYDSWEMTPPLTGQPPSAWTRKSETPRFTFVCDGTTNWRQFGTFYRRDAQTEAQSMNTILEPWNGFYGAQSSPYALTTHYQKQNGLLEARLDGREEVDKILCDRVFTHIKTSFAGSTQEYHTTWYVGVEDGLVRRKVERVDLGNRGGYVRDARLRKIQVNRIVENPGTVFTYVPPDGVTLQQSGGRIAPGSTRTRDTEEPETVSSEERHNDSEIDRLR